MGQRLCESQGPVVGGGGGHLQPPGRMTDTRRRVKVYTLNEDRQWDDRGTGHVSSGYVERLKGTSLLVRAESDGKPTGEARLNSAITCVSGAYRHKLHTVTLCKRYSVSSSCNSTMCTPFFQCSPKHDHHCAFFLMTGSLLLESKINPNTAYQKQQVSARHMLRSLVICASSFADLQLQTHIVSLSL